MAGANKPSSFSFVYGLLLFCFNIQLPLPLSSSAAAAASSLHSGHGFTVELIHRDSPLSPFYDPSSTKFDRLTSAFRRSMSRAARLNSSSKWTDDDGLHGIQSQIFAANGEYLMNLSIGTPPFQMLGIADTGSDLTWLQCQPCSHCFPQVARLFAPNTSSTYTNLPCQSQLCQAFDGSICGSTAGSNCQYKVTYGDQSYSIGDLAAETFTLISTSGRPVQVPNMAFGCGHSNNGGFDKRADGIIGLGRGPLSIINQMSDLVDGKFSYCLVPLDTNSSVTSKINFGEAAVVSGSGVVSTPLIKSTVDPFYYLTLESISVGNKTITVPLRSSGISKAGGGNIIIDSGTTLTLLPGDFYRDLESELKQVIHGSSVSDPQGLFSLCYSKGSGFSVPAITVRFSGGDALELRQSSTFVENGDLLCFAMIPSDELAIFGNLSQMNFLIGYDLEKNLVSFKPTDCTEH
ncbi:aspartic proteinase CDR1-like [Diospyros lotus]|uniref:aspartic proteinase CDR1-like n=1 Tax=Diospyros lotus TaxID=55363 RepID=UPI00224CCC62|nr:aspartic proteinase CDR1-like [Diospyros lotus]